VKYIDVCVYKYTTKPSHTHIYTHTHIHTSSHTGSQGEDRRPAQGEGGKFPNI
jgi:hypothetical protein